MILSPGSPLSISRDHQESEIKSESSRSISWSRSRSQRRELSVTVTVDWRVVTYGYGEAVRTKVHIKQSYSRVRYL